MNSSNMEGNNKINLEEIQHLDRLDEQFRNADLQEDVENLSSIHELNDLGESDSFFSSSAASSDRGENKEGLAPHPESNYSREQIIHLRHFASAGDNEQKVRMSTDRLGEQEEEEEAADEYQVMKRLTAELHERNAEKTALELQVNHLQLQVEALLSAQERQERDRDEVNLKLMVAQQNNLLLEARLREVAHHERVTNRTSVDSLRGKLLEAANQRHAQLLDQFQSLKTTTSMKAEEDASTIFQYGTIIDAMKKELHLLSEQLSSRTVLYQALHRRHQDTLRFHQQTMTVKEKDYYILQGELQSMTQKNHELQQELKELTYNHRSSEKDYQTLQAEFEQLQELNQTLGDDLVEARNINLSHQTMLDSFRSGNMDLEQIQIQHHQEITALRQQYAQQERSYQEEIAQVRQLLNKDSQTRDELNQWNLQLQQELQQKNQLLYAVQQQQQQESRQFTQFHNVECTAITTPKTEFNRNYGKDDDNDNENEEEEEDDEEQGSVSWLLTPNQSNLAENPSSSTKQVPNSGNTAAQKWLSLFPRLLRISLQWTDLWPLRTDEQISFFLERMTALAFKVHRSDQRNESSFTEVELKQSFSEDITPVCREIGNLFLQNYEITEKLLMEKFDVEIRRLKEKASTFRQKCAKLQQFSITLIERAGEKKLISLAEIPNELAISLSPNSSSSFSVLPVASVQPHSPGVNENEQIQQLKETISLYQQAVERLESQIVFYKQENDELCQQIQKENSKQIKIETLEQRFVQLEGMYQSKEKDYEQSIRRIQSHHAEEREALINQLTSDFEQNLKQIRDEGMLFAEEEKSAVRREYDRYITNLLETVKQYEESRAIALQQLTVIQFEKESVQQELQFLQSNLQALQDQSNLESETKLQEHNHRLDSLTKQFQQYEAQLLLQEEAKQGLQQLYDQLQVTHKETLQLLRQKEDQLLSLERFANGSRTYSTTEEEGIGPFERKGREEEVSLGTMIDNEREQGVLSISSVDHKINVTSLSHSPRLSADQQLSPANPPLTYIISGNTVEMSRYIAELCLTISSYQRSKFLAIEQINNLQYMYDLLQEKCSHLEQEYESQQRLFEKLSEEKIVVYQKLHSLESLLLQQEEQNLQRRQEYGENNQSLQQQYHEKYLQLTVQCDSSIQQLSESHAKELHKWQKQFKKEFQAQRKEYEQKLDDAEKQHAEVTERLTERLNQLQEEVEGYRSKEMKKIEREAALKIENTKEDSSPRYPEMSTELSDTDGSWFLSPEKPQSGNSEKSQENLKRFVMVSEESQTDPIQLDQLLVNTSAHSTNSRKSFETTSPSPVFVRRSQLLSPPTVSIQQSNEFDKLLSSIQQEETNLMSVRLELKELIAENTTLLHQKALLEENNSLLSNHLLKCNDKILSLHLEYSRVKDHYSILLQKEEGLLKELQTKEEILLALEQEKEKLQKERDYLRSQLQRGEGAPPSPALTTQFQNKNPLSSQPARESQSPLDRSHLEAPPVSIPAPQSILPPHTIPSQAKQDEVSNVPISKQYLKEQLHNQKLKLLQKFQKRYEKQQQIFEDEKQTILHLLRNECKEILGETNRLLLAKRELALQQSEVNEIIQELSQRAIFTTPSRIIMSRKAKNNDSFQTSAFQKPERHLPTHVTTISPITAVSNPSNHELEMKGKHDNHNHNLTKSAAQPPSQSVTPAPFPLPDHSANHHRSHHSREGVSSKADKKKRQEEHQKRKQFMNSSLLRDSINSLLSSTSSLPASMASSLNFSSQQMEPGTSNSFQQHSNPQEHLFRLYPEMIPPNVTKKLIHQILQHQSHSQIDLDNSINE